MANWHRTRTAAMLPTPSSALEWHGAAPRDRSPGDLTQQSPHHLPAVRRAASIAALDRSTQQLERCAFVAACGL